MYKILTKMCEDFNRVNDADISFGVGLDCGQIWRVYKKNDKRKINTFLGSVINRATRIEEATKMFKHTNMIVGGNVYNKLMADLYPLYYETISGYDNYDKLLIEKPEVILASQELLVYYIFEYELRGIGNPLPLYRLSHELVYTSKYNDVMKKISNKVHQLNKIIKE